MGDSLHEALRPGSAASKTKQGLIVIGHALALDCRVCVGSGPGLIGSLQSDAPHPHCVIRNVQRDFRSELALERGQTTVPNFFGTPGPHR